MKTQVLIVGGGPAGLLLSHLLSLGGVQSLVLEKKSRDYVLGRIRAGVLEQGLTDMLRAAGLGGRLDDEALVHRGFYIAHNGGMTRIDLSELAGRTVTIYGQTEVTRDLCDAMDARGGDIMYNAGDVTLHNLDGDAPYATWRHDGETAGAAATRRCDCDFVAGCDGFHGVSRHHIPSAARREYERVYPMGWLGLLSPTPPVCDELVYIRHARGFGLCSMRSSHLSRYYLQCAADEDVNDWPDERFWDELQRRLPPELAGRLQTAASVEKSVAPLRSFVVEPMRWRRLFLAGDAAHIVPPTGAKGLNLAASDVYFLSQALLAYYRENTPDKLDAYSGKALARVWKAQRFSWWMTSLLHNFPDEDAFTRRLREAELDYLGASSRACAMLAENYAGLPYEQTEQTEHAV